MPIAVYVQTLEKVVLEFLSSVSKIARREDEFNGTGVSSSSCLEFCNADFENQPNEARGDAQPGSIPKLSLVKTFLKTGRIDGRHAPTTPREASIIGQYKAGVRISNSNKSAQPGALQSIQFRVRSYTLCPSCQIVILFTWLVIFNSSRVG